MRAKLAIEQAEHERIEREKQRLQLVQQQRARYEQEEIEEAERKKRDIAVHLERVKQLDETILLFQQHEKKMFEMKVFEMERMKWDEYLKCDGVTDPTLVTEMHNYLYCWEEDPHSSTPEECKKRVNTIVKLLDKLQQAIVEPLGSQEDQVDYYKEVRDKARAHLRKQIDDTTYFILRNMDVNMTLVGLNELYYDLGNENLIIHLWSLIAVPRTYFPLRKEERPPLTCELRDIGITVALPDSLLDIPLVLRGARMKYDHLSDTCSTYSPIQLPEGLIQDMKTTVIKERKSRLEFEKEVAGERERRILVTNKVAAMKPSAPIKKKEAALKAMGRQTPSPEIEMLRSFSTTPIKTAFERFMDSEDIFEDSLRSKILHKLLPNELDLRKYIILGGVYLLDLLTQPPQPFELACRCVLTTS